jgi:hypothetical protein
LEDGLYVPKPISLSQAGYQKNVQTMQFMFGGRFGAFKPGFRAITIKNKRVPANRKKGSKIYIFCTKIYKPSCEELDD